MDPGVHLDDVHLPLPGGLHHGGIDRLQQAQRSEHPLHGRRPQDLEAGGAHQMVQPHQRALRGARPTLDRGGPLAVPFLLGQQRHRGAAQLNHLVHPAPPAHPASQGDLPAI